MRNILLISACFLLIFSASLFSEQLSPEEDAALYNQIMILRGQSGISQEVGEETQIIKCGTPFIMEIKDKVKYASPATQQAWAMFLYDRFDTEAPDTLGSPGGHFLIHYATTGVHAAYTGGNLGIDPGTGIPEYVESTAVIFDHVWEHEVTSLGFKAPLSDDFYPSGGDSRVDIYLVDLATIGQSGAYGVTFPDMAVGTGDQYYTAFQALDNDYQEITEYADRPLDALKVTAAHEFFHVIQFAYDQSEYESTVGDRPWMEMSAVWMEDEVYDDINDYYNYLNFFLPYVNRPLTSTGYYEYGAVLWPKFLAEKWGTGIIKSIWEKCETFPGPNVFQTAIPDAINEISSGNYDFGKALAEFHIWEYFTGTRSRPGFGFEEAADFKDINGDPIQVPDSIREGNYVHNIVSRSTYPIMFDVAFEPTDSIYALGTKYFRFSGFQRLDSTLTIGFKGARQRLLNHTYWPITWYNMVFAYNPNIPSQAPYIDTEVHLGDTSVIRLEEDLLNDYDEVILVLSPFVDLPPNLPRMGFLPYRISASDSSAAIEQITISDPFPNPYIISQSDGQELSVEVGQPEPQAIIIQVYTLAGEKIVEKTVETNKNFELVSWDGKNADGDLVASGMYLIYVNVGDANKVCKVAIIE